MKIAIKMMLLVMLCLTTSGFINKIVSKEEWAELKKKTVKGFTVPFVLRYDPDLWEEREYGYSYLSRKASDQLGRKVHLLIRVDKNEKNMDVRSIEDLFQKDVSNNHSEYSIKNFSLSKSLEINNIHFVVCEASFKHQTDEAIDCHVMTYWHSDDAGVISLQFRSSGVMTEEDQEVIDGLLTGFSLDGSASRGPAKLRMLKTILEHATSK